MYLHILKSKLKEVIVTSANTEYEGSLTLDPLLMRAANLVPNERVEVNDKEGEARIVTYVISGIEGSGQVELNGGAANFFDVGDRVHVNCFALCEPDDIPIPLIVYTDENNKVTEVK